MGRTSLQDILYLRAIQLLDPILVEKQLREESTILLAAWKVWVVLAAADALSAVFEPLCSSVDRFSGANEAYTHKMRMPSGWFVRLGTKARDPQFGIDVFASIGELQERLFQILALD